LKIIDFFNQCRSGNDEIRKHGMNNFKFKEKFNA